MLMLAKIANVKTVINRYAWVITLRLLLTRAALLLKFGKFK